ncbi:MAG: DUF401 family protein [Candidatus Altiarchaeota archaeon]
MLLLAKILTVFVLLVYLVRRNVNVGLALTSGAALFGLLFGLSPRQIAYTALYSCIDSKTLNLLAVVLLITLLGNVLKRMENLRMVVKSMGQLVADARIVMAAIPAFIGLMPMPGGAMLSAPLTGEVADKVGLGPESKTMVNYWFRHVWEYTFPLYPGIILASTLFGITLRDILLTNGPTNIFAVLVGILLILAPIGKPKSSGGKHDKMAAVWALVKSIWPIAVVITANIVFGVDLILSLIAVLTVLFLQTRFFRGFSSAVFRESVTPSLVFLILSVMVFKSVIEETGGVSQLPELFVGYGIPIPLILFIVPFIVGMLLGLTVGYVGMTFPLLSVFISNGSFNYSYFMLAYVGGFMGVMASPAHLCLVLTREYYKADFKAVYRKIIPLVLMVSAFTWFLYLVKWPL